MKNSRGFTLIELIVSMAVLGVIIVLVMNFLTNKLVSNALQNARATILHQNQLTLDLLGRDIRHAANVDATNRWEDAYAPGAPADEYSWVSDADTLVLAEPAVDENNNILYEDPSAYISYKNNAIFFLENGVLYKRILAVNHVDNEASTTCPAGTANCPSDIKLSEGVTNFTITYYDANDSEVAASAARSVAVTLAVQDEIYGQTISATHTIRSVFRNE